MSKLNFFEALGIADMEKAHTQTMYWILSTESEVLTKKDRLNFLNSFFGLTILDYSKFEVFTEYNKIDLAIAIDNQLVYLENKLKSTQHSNQLKRYDKFINQNYEILRKKENLVNNEFKPKKLFLSLISEKAESGTWENKTYEELYWSLCKLDLYLNKENQIFNEYVESLKRLINIFNIFNQDHTKFKHLFKDGCLKKEDKDNNYFKINKYSEEDIYIAKNQLETIFQIYFLRKIGKEITNDFVDFGETRGTALINIPLNKNIEFKGKSYWFTYQIQGKTRKITFARAERLYWESNISEFNHTHVIEKFTNLFSKSEGYKFNKGKTKAYISCSKRLDKEVCEFSFKELVQIYSDDLKEIRLKLDKDHNIFL